MYLYCVVFAISLLFMGIADYFKYRVKTWTGKGAGGDPRRNGIFQCGWWLCTVLSACSLIALSGFRYGVGIDYFYSYVPSLEEVREGRTSHYDWLFNKVIWLFSRLQDNQWFFMGMAILTVGLTYYAILKELEYGTVALGIFLCSFHYLRSFSFVAQYFAMSLALVSFVFLIQGKRKTAIVGFVLAALMHQSALALVFVLLCYFLSEKANILLSAILPLLALITSSVVRSIVERLAGQTRFAYYFGSNYDSGYIDKSLILVNLALLCFYLAVWFYTRNGKSKNDPKVPLYCSIQSIALTFSILQPVIPVGYRFVWYYMFFQILSIPYLAKKFAKTDLYVFTCVLILLCYFLWMVKVPIANGASQVLPYVSIFSAS